jgi:hypothetical protein
LTANLNPNPKLSAADTNGPPQADWCAKHAKVSTFSYGLWQFLGNNRTAECRKAGNHRPLLVEEQPNHRPTELLIALGLYRTTEQPIGFIRMSNDEGAGSGQYTKRITPRVLIADG